MQISAPSALRLATLLFATVLLPGSAWANKVTNCPVEPAQGTAISSGQTYTGANCALKTTGDLDTFTFTASKGDTWSMFTGVEPNPASNICLNLYAPGSTGTPIFTGCTNIAFSGFSTGTTMKLTVTGTYTIAITETANGTTGYSLSLERIDPPPPDALPLPLKTNLTGDVGFPTEQNAYVFYAATTGTYHLAASYTSGPDNVCFNIYQAGTSIKADVALPQCTNIAFSGFTIQANFTPAANGTFVAVLYSGNNDSTVNYNLELTCFLGTCPNTTPKCSMSDALSYNSSTGILTMNFTLFTPVAVTWNGWLVSKGTVTSMWSQSQAITSTPITVTKTQSVSKAGKVGALSTFTTTNGGITCSNWSTIYTTHP